MNAALLKLMLLTGKAALRRTLRGVKTVRGAFLLLFTIGLVVMMIVPQVLQAYMLSGQPALRQVSTTAESIAPLALLGFTLMFVFTSAGERAISFAPAEVDFLFAAPFSRREILVYKLVKMALAMPLMSAFFSLTMMAYFPSWLSGFVGITLALAMAQLVGMTTALVGQLVAESAYTRARRLALLAVAICALAGLAQVVGRAEFRGFAELLADLRRSSVFRVLLAPFEVFTRAIFAPRAFPDLVGWGGAALAVDAALLLVVLRLDSDYLESAATISQKVYERIRRMKQGGGLAMPVGPRAGKLRLAQLPWLWGAGPIAWRQLLLTIRTARHMLITTAALLVLVAAGFAFPAGPGRGPSPLLPAIGTAMTFYMTFIFAMQLPWAFRGDVDHIDFLKTLPVHPAILTAGELAGGILLLSAIQLVLFAILAGASPGGLPILLTAAAFCLPLNTLILSLNNLLFLFYPVRHPAGTTFDFQMFGKLMLFMFLQFLLLIPLLGIPAALGGVAYYLADYSAAAFAVTAWLVLAVELPPLVLIVAWAFQRFDVSTQTPP